MQPVFENTDKSFHYPDTYDDGSWKVTNPRAELLEMLMENCRTKGRLRKLCRMTRTWRNKHGVGALNGLLIDSFVWRFLKDKAEDELDLFSYGELFKEFLIFLSERDEKEFYRALGSQQKIRTKGNFQRPAKKGAEVATEALSASAPAQAHEKWRQLFGRDFPKFSFVSQNQRASATWRETEEWVEDKFPVDIDMDLELETLVGQKGYRYYSIADFVAKFRFLKARYSLTFKVSNYKDFPNGTEFYWKVLNKGPEAEKRDCIRGQIYRGNIAHKEPTNFKGDHMVECYAVFEDVVIARKQQKVPIGENADDIEI